MRRKETHENAKKVSSFFQVPRRRQTRQIRPLKVCLFPTVRRTANGSCSSRLPVRFRDTQMPADAPPWGRLTGETLVRQPVDFFVIGVIDVRQCLPVFSSDSRGQRLWSE